MYICFTRAVCGTCLHEYLTKRGPPPGTFVEVTKNAQAYASDTAHAIQTHIVEERPTVIIEMSDQIADCC